MTRAAFQWDDPFHLDQQLTEDERAIRDAAAWEDLSSLQSAILARVAPLVARGGLLVGGCTSQHAYSPNADSHDSPDIHQSNPQLATKNDGRRIVARQCGKNSEPAANMLDRPLPIVWFG